MRANVMRATVRQRLRRRPLSCAAGAIVVAVFASACTGPAPTTSTYENKAVQTADEVVSASRTVVLAATTGDAGRSFATTIAVAIAEAEDGADTARDAFASIQPPDTASDQLRASLLPTVQRACDVIAEVRIAARRSESDLTQVAAPLVDIANQLESFSSRYG